MNVLVTGGAGLIGMALRRVLAVAGHTVTAIDLTDFGRQDRDLVLMPLSDQEGMARLVDERGVDAIVHGGGVSGPVMEADRPTHIAQTNTTSTAALLEIAHRQRARFLLLSSHVIYGDCGNETIHEDRPAHPRTFYAASKVGAESFVESAREVFGLEAASLRITRVYGPYRRANCFLRQAILDAKEARTTEIPSDPEFPYHYIHVDDVAGAVLACLSAPLRHPAYNVTSDEVLFMPEIAEIMRSVLPKANIVLPEGRDDASEIQARFSLSRIKSDTGWHPRLSLRDGFASYIKTTQEDAECLQ